MRPIETKYRGETFKSRMEARWAVFFDTLDVEWTYEVCQYESPTAGRYTPDFLVRAGSELALAEVKPEWPTGMEVHKFRAASGKSGLPVAILIGTPAFKHYWTVTENDEKLVFVWSDGDLLVPAPMDVAEMHHQFGLLYHEAVDRANKSRFDGWDDDRSIIDRRYQ
jgi:hypothetical protein